MIKRFFHSKEGQAISLSSSEWDAALSQDTGLKETNCVIFESVMVYCIYVYFFLLPLQQGGLKTKKNA